MIEIGSIVEIIAIGKDDAHSKNKALLGLRGKIVKPCKVRPGGMFTCDLKIDKAPYLNHNICFNSVRLKEIK